MTPKYPHCDANVLHKPNECTFCDMYPEAQQARIDGNINFTGENDPNKKPCPAQTRRSLDTIYAWHGNVPWDEEAQQANMDSWVESGEPKCECGADSIGYPGHSDWCPKAVTKLMA